ncbi:uncharacterized protein LOC129590771 [Paramacrobiotus metropolitanus]|uniref:uncharacterized protein LOC129590771 n=1 Tax=Paramacrobiotus metropolitanus TaxID=2943436 RepID=UPI00244591AB|nr:uncharacterized protein LOC129590771 [Paramacrobiotus metropolitanus]
MPVAKVTKDDSAIRNVSNPLRFIRSRSCGDLSTFDPAFDDVVGRAVEKNSYAKRLKPLVRQLALLSLARNLLFCAALAVRCMGLIIAVRTGGELENQERDNQDESYIPRPFPLEYVPALQGVILACSLIDLFFAFLLWNGVRKMHGSWFLSAANLRDGTRISIGCYESNFLKEHLEEHFTYTVLGTALMLLVVGLIEFFYPRLFLGLWLFVLETFWYYSTVDAAGYAVLRACALLLATLPCIGLAVAGLNIARKSRPIILQFRQIFYHEMHLDIAFDQWDDSNLIGWFCKNWPVFRYRVPHCA